MMRRWLILAALLAASTTLHGYTFTGPKWAVSTVPYFVNTTSKYFTPDEVLSVMQAQAGTWNGVSNVDFQYAGTTTRAAFVNDGNNDFFLRDAINSGGAAGEAYWWWNGAFQLIDVDIVLYEGGYSWVTQPEPCNGQLYFENFLIHEMGHALGLGHSEVPDATMRTTGSYCDVSQTTLEPDDIAGIGALYGTTPPDPPSPPSAPTLSVRAYKVKGEKRTDLTWVNLTYATVDLYREGVVIQVTANDGAYTDPVGGRGGGSLTYRVCDTGTTTCTNSATATW